MSYLDRNLLAINTVQKNLKSAVLHNGHSGIRLIQTKNGQKVPQFLGKTLASSYDPVKEGIRISESITEDCFIVLFGIGSGHLLEALLENPNIKGILAVEPEIGILKELLINIDFVRLFRNPKLHISCLELHPSPAQLLVHLYLPLIHGTFQTVSLRNYTEIYIEEFNDLKQNLKIAIDSIADDISVQKKFGKRWFKQSLFNIKKLYQEQPEIDIHTKAVVCGAGPELEDHLDTIMNLGKQATIIATDTAFPILVKNKIRVDYLFSIDCQIFTKLHVLGHTPPTMILDFASPLSNIHSSTFICGSAYPFSQYVKENACNMYTIDTSGGNVTYSALSFLDKTKVQEVHIFGADFYNPLLKSYARGSYLYDFFYENQEYTKPIENSFLHFAYQYENPTEPKHMHKYRIKFTELCTTVSCRVYHYHKGAIDQYPANQGDTRRIIRNPAPKIDFPTFWSLMIQDFYQLKNNPNFLPAENPLYASLISIMPSLQKKGEEGIKATLDWVLDTLSDFNS